MSAAAPWLTVVGCLPDGSLAPTAPADALGVDAVFGAARLLAAAGVPAASRRPWPRPFADGIAALLARRGTPTTVLASGDPLHHGVGTTLLEHVEAQEIAIHPAPSAFSLAAAAMRWPLEGVRPVTLHSRPAAAIAGALAPGRRLLVLTRDGEAPAAIAAAATAAGYGASDLAVLENLGSPAMARHDATAATLSGVFAPLNTLAIACRRKRPVAVDDLAHDGCVTRDEIRRLSIGALGDGAGHLWDVGAGSGAVAIDWCTAGGSATLFERHPARCDAIAANLAATATEAALFVGEAADNLAFAATPGAIFLGGAVADEALFAALWARLAPGGILVANAVTVEGEAAVMQRFATLGGALTRIALSHNRPIGGLTALAPAMPVLQWRIEKT
ncbi:MAG: bifunctional cobalt-precorrin-7 (C(5))-methyltransferase/cobalt-precorrin-6B (C(15))-methyltransferase [Acuticoccus sp.]